MKAMVQDKTSDERRLGKQQQSPKASKGEKDITITKLESNKECVRCQTCCCKSRFYKPQQKASHQHCSHLKHKQDYPSNFGPSYANSYQLTSKSHRCCGSLHVEDELRDKWINDCCVRHRQQKQHLQHRRRTQCKGGYNFRKHLIESQPDLGATSSSVESSLTSQQPPLSLAITPSVRNIPTMVSNYATSCSFVNRVATKWKWNTNINSYSHDHHHQGGGSQCMVANSRKPSQSSETVKVVPLSMHTHYMGYSWCLCNCCCCQRLR